MNNFSLSQSPIFDSRVPETYKMLTNKQETGNSKFLGSFDQLEQAIYRVGYCKKFNRITLNSSGARWRGRGKEGLVGHLTKHTDSYSDRGFGWTLRGNTNTR